VSRRGRSGPVSHVLFRFHFRGGHVGPEVDFQLVDLVVVVGGGQRQQLFGPRTKAGLATTSTPQHAMSDSGEVHKN
jgi:hypothetical protein